MSSTPPAALFTAGWFKSSYSANNNECIEVATAGPRVGLRDSKDVSRPPIVVSAGAFHAFITALRTDVL